MTNREWLNTLSDEDFTKWCLYEAQNFFNRKTNEYDIVQPYPTLHTIKISFTSSYDGLLKWLNEERIEGGI